jgi:hypothetical protein
MIDSKTSYNLIQKVTTATTNKNGDFEFSITCTKGD